jgi:type IV pilus assembly protein PilM
MKQPKHDRHVVNPDGHVIGIDLGATAVRAAVLTPRGLESDPSEHGIARAALPAGAVEDGVVTEKGAVSSALKHLWRKHRFACRKVVLGIANPQVLVREMQIPEMDAQQRAKALPFLARDIVALPIDQVLLDFVALGEADPDSGLVDGLLVVTPNEPVMAAVQAVEHAGLSVVRVDLSAFGALRAIANESFTTEGVVDLGAQLTTIAVHHHGVPKLVRSVSQGGQELTTWLAERVRMSTEDAEAAKRKIGLADPDSPVTRALREGIRALLAEIRSSVNYFASTHDGAALQQLSLTGGGAALPGLAELLAEQIGVPVQVVDPMRRVSSRPDQSQPDAEAASAVSIGLAMGAAA